MPEVLTAAPLLVLRVVAGLLIHVCCITPNGSGAASSTPRRFSLVCLKGIACRAQRRREISSFGSGTAGSVTSPAPLYVRAGTV